MRTVSAITLFLFLTLSALQTRAATYIVRMSNYAFTPAEIDIDVGDSITWSNAVPTGHDTFCQGVWWSGETLLGFRKTFTFNFNVEPGTYDYVCTPHASLGMVGTVRVHAVIPPSINITAPPNQSTFLEGQSIDVTTDADPATVAKVDLLVDDNRTPLQTKTSAPFNFTFTLPAGAHKLTTRATNAKGVTAESSILVSVLNPNLPPAVSITSPTNTSVFQAPIDLTIEAFASHPSGIDHVEFFANGASIGTDATAPYAIVHTFTNGGPVTLTAQAFSKNNLSAISEGITISLTEAIPSAPQITFLSPTNGSFVTFASNIVLAARAVDPDGSIANVKFFEDTNLLGTVTAPGASNRFELLTSLTEGVHTLFATTTDNKGIISTSQPPVTFTVLMQPIITSSNLVNPSTLRLSFFGSSGVPYVFEYTADMVHWIPFKTNQLYRRILFFDVPVITNQVRIYRAGFPSAPTSSGGTSIGETPVPIGGGVTPPPPINRGGA
jgi:plastocyanin